MILKDTKVDLFNKKILFVVTYLLTILTTALVTFVIMKPVITSSFIEKANKVQKTGEFNRASCTDANLMLDQLPQYIKQNEYALNLLRKDCSFVVNSFQQDVNNDGLDETFMQTTSLDCGTGACKARTLYIITDKDSIFYEQGAGLYFEKTGSKDEFNVVKPVQYWNERPTYSSKELVVTYKYDKQEVAGFKPVNTSLRTSGFEN